jgi:hypothetical protein
MATRPAPKPTRSEIARKAALARWRKPTSPDLSRMVEVLPGLWQPEDMDTIERWKLQQRRRNGRER